MKYSQNSEEEIVLNYFGDFVGTFWDIGAFSGVELSNTRALAIKGWRGILVEASPTVFEKLAANYENYSSDQIRLYNIAIGEETGVKTFYDNHNAVGTLHKEETKRWGESQSFGELQVSCYDVWDFVDLVAEIDFNVFDFISIDIEGSDIDVLKQMDLGKLGCRCLCIEHNSVPERIETISNYCSQFGLKEIHRNGENIILAK